MAKVKNRKKAYKLALKQAGRLKGQAAESRVESKPSSKPRSSVSLENFATSEAVTGLRANLIETLYQAGIQSAEAFQEFTEADLLALKGIGPATISKLQENGVRFKA